MVRLLPPMMEERTVAAAILGELVPELEYAAPCLLDRLKSGAPLIDRKSPSDIGFEIGRIDAQLLELFRALASYVSAMLSYGILELVQSRGKKSQEELRAEVRALRIRCVEIQEAMDSMKRTLDQAGDVVSQSELDEAIVAAIARLDQEER